MWLLRKKLCKYNSNKFIANYTIKLHNPKKSQKTISLFFPIQKSLVTPKSKKRFFTLQKRNQKALYLLLSANSLVIR